MSTSKAIDKICIIAVVVALLISILFMNGTALGIQIQHKAMGYEDRLFDTSRVHTIDIVMDDWDAFLQTVANEEYAACNVVIDGESFKNVGIRGKGNTSLSTVAMMNSARYSFKIEFDQYDSTKSYYGLDKLNLNNLIQDNTMMKDYLTYQMMQSFGVVVPLCSYVYISVNGEDWGLYLAVEAVEESFLQRNYGNDYGELYKPDSMNMGGGRGNGQAFDVSEAMDTSAFSADTTIPNMATPEAGGGFPEMGGGFDPGQMGAMPGQPGMNPGAAQPGSTDASQQHTANPGEIGSSFVMDPGEVKLQYVDDRPDSYPTIFSSAKTDPTFADQIRLITALKDLSERKESAVDTEALLRYFVVHNFVVNGDSYTGTMIHNYYLYEEDGQLSMIPWDYNLAFGTFYANEAADAVNDDIDSPLSVTGNDRPMIDWIFDSEEYTELYHRYFSDFLDMVDTDAIISQAKTLIAPYVEKDPTKFCTYAEFEKGVETLTTFCDLRSKSVAVQLMGKEATIDASELNLADMGIMGAISNTMQMPGQMGGATPPANTDVPAGAAPQMPGMTAPGGMTPPEGMTAPEGMTPPEGMTAPEGMTPPEGMTAPTAPEGMAAPGGAQAPQDSANTTPNQSSNKPGNTSGKEPSDNNGASTGSPWIWLAASVVLMAAGLLFAFKFKQT